MGTGCFDRISLIRVFWSDLGVLVELGCFGLIQILVFWSVLDSVFYGLIRILVFWSDPNPGVLVGLGFGLYGLIRIFRSTLPRSATLLLLSFILLCLLIFLCLFTRGSLSISFLIQQLFLSFVCTPLILVLFFVCLSLSLYLWVPLS